jgi:hypothetical protein
VLVLVPLLLLAAPLLARLLPCSQREALEQARRRRERPFEAGQSQRAGGPEQLLHDLVEGGAERRAKSTKRSLTGQTRFLAFLHMPELRHKNAPLAHVHDWRDAGARPLHVF